MARLLLSVVFSFWSCLTFANAPKDSLLTLLKNAGDSSITYQMDLALELISAYRKIDNLDSQFYYANDVLRIAKIGKNANYLAKAHQALGVIYSGQKAYDSAKSHFDSSLINSTAIKDTSLITRTTFDLGVLYYKQGRYPEALPYFERIRDKYLSYLASNNRIRLFNTFNAIGVNNKLLSRYDTAIVNYERALAFVEAGSKYEGIIYSNVKNIYMVKGDHYAAIDYTLKGLKVFEKLNDTLGIALAYTGLAQLYEEIQNYDLAFQNVKKSIELQSKEGTKLKDLLESNYLQLTHFYLIKEQIDTASLWLEKAKILNQESRDKETLYRIYIRSAEIAQKRNDIKTAEENFHKGLELSLEMQDPWSEGNCLVGLGQLYVKKNELEKAITYLKRGLTKSHQANAIRLAKDAEELLSKVYEKQNKLDSAYYHAKNFYTLSDSLLNLKKLHEIAALERQFQGEQQKREIAEQQIELLKKDQQIKQSYITGVSAFLLVLIILSTVLYLSYRKQQKLNLSLNKSLAYLESVNQKIAQTPASPPGQADENNNDHLSLEQKVFQKIELLSKNIESVIHGNIEGQSSEELIMMEDKFTAIIDELKAFNYTVAHDLRIPLAHIQHLTEQLKTKAKSLGKEEDTNLVEQIEHINVASKKLEGMFQKLLQYSKIENQSLDYSTFDLEILVNDVIHEFEPDMKGADYKIDIRLNHQKLFADVLSIRQVLYNLISNALKFSKHKKCPQDNHWNKGKRKRICYLCKG